jgi:hypothetical protein
VKCELSGGITPKFSQFYGNPQSGFEANTVQWIIEYIALYNFWQENVIFFKVKTSRVSQKTRLFEKFHNRCKNFHMNIPILIAPTVHCLVKRERFGTDFIIIRTAYNSASLPLTKLSSFFQLEIHYCWRSEATHEIV